MSEIPSTLLLELVAMIFFFLLSFLFFRLSSACKFQHFSFVWPSMLKWLQWLLDSYHWCIVVFLFLSFPHLFFFFPSLEASFSFYFVPVDCAIFNPMFSRYYACTQALSIDLGLKNTTCSRRWQYRPPKYLRSTFGFFGEIPNIIAIFLNFVVYSFTFWLGFFLK